MSEYLNRISEFTNKLNIINKMEYSNYNKNNNIISNSYTNYTNYLNNYNLNNYLFNNVKNANNIYYMTLTKNFKNINKIRLRLYINIPINKNLIPLFLENFEFELEIGGCRILKKNFYNILIEFGDTLEFNYDENYIEFTLFNFNLNIYCIKYNEIHLNIDFKKFENFDNFCFIYDYYDVIYDNPNSKLILINDINSPDYTSIGFFLYFNNLNNISEINNIYLSSNKTDKIINFKFELVYIYNIPFYCIFIDNKINNYDEFKQKFFSNKEIDDLTLLYDDNYYSYSEKLKLNIEPYIPPTDYTIISYNPNILHTDKTAYFVFYS